MRLNKQWRLRRSVENILVDRLDRVGEWSTVCALSIEAPASGLMFRKLEVSNKTLYVLPASDGRPDPFRNDSRELRHVVRRAVQLGMFGAELEPGENIKMEFGRRA